MAKALRLATCLYSRQEIGDGDGNAHGATFERWLATGHDEVEQIGIATACQDYSSRVGAFGLRFNQGVGLYYLIIVEN